MQSRHRAFKVFFDIQEYRKMVRKLVVLECRHSKTIPHFLLLFLCWNHKNVIKHSTGDTNQRLEKSKIY